MKTRFDMATVSSPIPPTPTTAPVKRTVTRRKTVPKVVAQDAPIATPVTIPKEPIPVQVESIKTLDTILKEIPSTAQVVTSVPVPELSTDNDEELDVALALDETSAIASDGTALTTPSTKKKTVKGANKERLFQEFEKLYDTLEKLLTEQNLKGVLKDTKSVRDMTYRLLKLKTVERQKRDTNNSGFMKPVRVSQQLEAFLKKNGLYQSELTRAYLTTVLCSYIKSKDLQNPADRRIIFPDEDLKLLFDITDGNTSEPEPLTYYTLQKRIQTHIFKT